MQASPKLVRTCKRTCKRAINVYMNIKDQQGLDIAARRMNMGQLPAPVSGEFADLGGGMFKPAASSGFSDGLQITQASGSSSASMPAFEELEAGKLTPKPPDMASANSQPTAKGSGKRGLK